MAPVVSTLLVTILVITGVAASADDAKINSDGRQSTIKVKGLNSELVDLRENRAWSV